MNIQEVFAVIREESAVFYVFAFIIGACFGSFLNVLILRLPDGESVVYPPSRCPGCFAKIAWYDNLPIVSWLLLRGQCRHCRRSFSVMYMLTELLFGFLALYSFHQALEYERAIVFPGLLLFYAWLYSLALIDYRHYRLPDFLTLTFPLFTLMFQWRSYGEGQTLYIQLFTVAVLVPMIIPEAVLGLVAFVGGEKAELKLYRFWVRRGWINADSSSPNLPFLICLSACLVGASYFWLNRLPFLFYEGRLQGMFFTLGLTLLARYPMKKWLGSEDSKELLGMGDVKLMAALGLYFGFPGVLIVFVLAALLAIPFSLYLLIVRRGSGIPFGVFLALSVALHHTFRFDRLVWSLLYSG